MNFVYKTINVELSRVDELYLAEVTDGELYEIPLRLNNSNLEDLINTINLNFPLNIRLNEVDL